MNEHKHGEPWEVEEDGRFNEVNIYDKEGNGVYYLNGPKISQRIVLCVNACAGMSDEEVEGIHGVIAGCRDGWDLAMDDNKALKSDLDEAVVLLDRAYDWFEMCSSECLPHGNLYDNMRDLLNRLEDKS